MAKSRAIEIVNVIEIDGVEYIMDDLPEEKQKELAYQLSKTFITAAANYMGYEVVEKKGQKETHA